MEPETQTLIDEINALPGWRAAYNEDWKSVIVTYTETRNSLVKACDVAMEEEHARETWTRLKAQVEHLIDEAFAESEEINGCF